MLPDRSQLRHDGLSRNTLDDFYKRWSHSCSPSGHGHSHGHDIGIDNQQGSTLCKWLVQLCGDGRRRVLSDRIPMRIQLYGSVNGDPDGGQGAGHERE